MRLAKRIKPKTSVKKSWEPEPYPVKEQVLDWVCGFIVMLDCCLEEDSKFSLEDTFSYWYQVAFKKPLDVYSNDFSPAHNMLQIVSKLYLNGCAHHKIVPDRGFIRLFKAIQSDRFLELSNEQAIIIGKHLSKYIPIKPKTGVQKCQ